jgi:hypothetical protein
MLTLVEMPTPRAGMLFLDFNVRGAAPAMRAIGCQ